MDFNFAISPVAIGLFEISIIATICALALFLWRILPLHRYRRASRRRDMSAAAPTLGASVVVYSNDQAEELVELLPRLLGQDYAPGFEVIVVNEGDSPRVRAIVDELQLRHRNLYLTFTPDGARNLSRKKLALTLGIKAARYPVVVHTCAGASVGSEQWLARMMQHFAADNHTEIVLGIAVPDTADDTALWRRIRSFDLAVDTVAWLSDAIAGKAWRGTEYNLAYRRDTFFRNKGFSSCLNLRHGDDDIFVSQVATRANTAVELSDESVVTVPGSNTLRALRDRNVQRRFTRRFIHRRPRLLGAMGWWLYLIAFVAALIPVVTDPRNGFIWLCTAICLFCWAMAVMVWHNAITAMRGRKLLLTLPFIAAMRPLRKSVGAVMARFAHGKRYTWE